MSDFDLWEDDLDLEFESDSTEEDQKEPEIKETPVEEGFIAPHFSKNGLLRISNENIELFTRGNLRKHKAINNDLDCIYGLVEMNSDGIYYYKIRLGAVNAFILRYVLRLVPVEISATDGKILASFADKIKPPVAVVSETGKHIEIQSPNIKAYQDVFKKVNAYPTNSGYRVGIGRVLDLEALVKIAESTLPKIAFHEDVLKLSRDPIEGFDGSLQSLKSIPIETLNVVSSNLQQWKHLKTNKKPLEEKFVDFGIATLHDLLFTLPKRFIDKSKPQDMDGLIEGESVTVVGTIASVANLPNNMGVYFMLEDGKGRKLKSSFWRQQWLKTKFKPGEGVLLTGKVTRFRGKIELNGSSIEHAEEAAVLPIVPIYKQSESRGITTYLIMSAAREFLSRAGKIELPPYLKNEGRLDYTQALTELHFPSSLETFKSACDDLAYYELVYMQLLMQEAKDQEGEKFGLSQRSTIGLQQKAIDSLPFSLTGAQTAGIEKMNELLADYKPTQTLLNGDVGSGKTIVAQMSCLQSVDAGYQAVLIGPTEILARQLYSTFVKLNEGLKKVNSGITIEFLEAKLKAAEKRALLKRVAEGEVDVLVGTTSVLGKAVSYKNLGVVVIDEQQKFGAEQRTQLLSSRSDGRVPDLLMQSATPIPRSTAQVFYGDMEMILLSEKPPGRLPIITEWIEEDPVEFAHQVANSVWSDVQKEASKGNQTFVITPMVQDSDRVDAASVERTYTSLKDSTLRGLSVGHVHGRMKKEEQQEIMADFRAKKYDVLVASTVVEVGVDIPDATRVVILSADRMGASSLHQIRGRAGRNSKQSKCYLVSLGKTANSQVRLQSLVDSENGFDIALADLEVRGEGRMFGADQSGSSEMIFASLARHKEWIEQAKNDAKEILSSSYKNLALEDAKARYESAERLF